MNPASFVAKRRLSTIVLVVAIVSTGAALRLHELRKSTIGHIEIYVPGIDLPYALSDPRPRHSIVSILSGAVAAEPHPPGYYLIMLGWTKLFGTGVAPLRLPSVLCGIGSILLIYVLGVREMGRSTALLAAMLLALNGHHLFWSQIAKMYALAVFLGLLSTLLLLSTTAAAGKRRGWLLSLYGAVTLAGLGTVVYFWPLFLTHILWSLRGQWTQRRTVPDVLQGQLLIFILASPLWAVAAYQSRRPSYISADILSGLWHYLQFGFLLEPDAYAVPPASTSPVLTTLIGLAGALLLLIGLRARGVGRAPPADSVSIPRPVTLVAAIVAAGAIVAFAVVARAVDPSRTPYIAACAAIPLVLGGLDRVVRRRWSRVQQWGMALNRRLPGLSGADDNSLIPLLAILPAAMVALVSLITPIFVSSGVMLFAPYLTLVLSGGLVWLVRHERRAVTIAGVLLGIIIMGTHALSAVQSKRRLRHPSDYQGLAQRWQTRIHSSDLIFTHRHWALTPIFYYLGAGQYHFVGGKYAEVAHQPTSERIWLLSAEGLPTPADMQSALAHHKPCETVEALRLRATLYQRPTSPAQ